ncbi:MAG: L-threonine 3-dehydrogenase [Acidimicrobiales bacterium]
MLALVKTEAAPGLTLLEVPVPDIGPDDVLIEVRRAAICGTDLHIHDWDDWAAETIPIPLVIGHEFMGTVAALGDNVGELRIGQRVSAEGHITCGRCRNCRAGRRHLCRNAVATGVQRDGAFAQYVAVPAFNVYTLPDHIDDDTGAVLDPLGNAVHTALTFDLVSEDVLIIGAGPIGLMAVPIAHRAGARHVVITDVEESRLELARTMGATRAVNVGTTSLVETMADLGMREGFDVGLEMSGAAAGLQQLIEVMNHGGRVALLGLVPAGTPIAWDKVIFGGLTLQGIYGRKMFDTWYKAANLLQNGLDLSPLFTHRFSMHEFEAAFDALRHEGAAKVFLEWPDPA